MLGIAKRRGLMYRELEPFSVRFNVEFNNSLGYFENIWAAICYKKLSIKQFEWSIDNKSASIYCDGELIHRITRENQCTEN